MKTFSFNTTHPLCFHWVGKFQSPNENWKHLSRYLTDYELFIVTEGTLYIADSKHHYELKEKEYLIMPPNTKQFGYKSSNCTFYWLHFQESPLLESNQAEKDSSLSLPKKAYLPHMERLIILLKQLQDSERRYHNKEYNHYLTTSILYEIDCQLRSPIDNQQVVHGKIQLFTDITDYISLNIELPMKVEDVAANFGYSTKYLSSFFQKSFGTSMKTYILNTKMDVAKAMLTDTNLTISQIAYNIGFTNSHNFSTCFKKIVGLTPSDYRDGYAKRILFHQ